MDLTFTESERDVRSAARRLFEAVLGDGQRAAIEDSQDESVLRAVVAAVGRGGWLTPATLDSPLFDRMPFFAEAGAALAPGLISNAIAGGSVLAHSGSAGLAEAVEQGDLLLTIASDAPRSGLASTRQQEPLTLDVGRLRGTLKLVEYGSIADLALVLVGRPGRQAACTVDLRGSGVIRIPRRTFGSDFRADLVFDIEMPAPDPVAEDDNDPSVATVRAVQTAIRVVECGGAARAVTSRTVNYVNTRQQFGKPLSQFQAVKQHAADMLILSEGAYLLAVEALAAVEDEGARSAALKWAAAWVPRAFKDVTLWAHQLHGGIGYARESHLFRWSERAKLREVELESQLDHRALIDGLSNVAGSRQGRCARELNFATLTGRDRGRSAPS